jgi:hypothetical protein
MSQSKQKEAVFSAVSSVLAEANITVNEGDNFATHLSRELRAQVTNILVEGFTSGNISLEKTFESEADLRTYCSGITSNWLRKDPRMNGGVKYVAKNPGSRVGSADPQLKAMRTLLATRTDLNDADRSEIQGMIDKRVFEVKSSKKSSAKELTAEQIEILKNAGLSSYITA